MIDQGSPSTFRAACHAAGGLAGASGGFQASRTTHLASVVPALLTVQHETARLSP
jgi:hypothetical protein